VVVSRSKESKDGGTAEEKFAVEAPASGSAKRWKLSSALYSLANLKAAAFTGTPKDLAKYGLDKARTYTVVGQDGKPAARVKIGGPVPKNDKRVYAMAEGGDKVVEIEKATADELPKTLEDVLDTPPPAANAGTPSVQASTPKQ
jgi:hypothetical protein